MSALDRCLRDGRAIGAVVLVVCGWGASSGCGRSVELFATGGAGGTGASGTQASGTQSSGTQSSGTQSSGTQSSGTQSSGTQSSGTLSSGTGLDASAATGITTCPGYGDMCTECAAASCPDVWCGCRNDPECIALFGCWNQCTSGDQGCIQMCMTAHQAGVSAALLVSDCAGTTCSGSCQGGQPQKPCTVCLLDNCSTAMNACFADAECLPLFQCLSACPKQSLACQQGCYAAHGAGVPTLQSVLDCSNAQCAMICQ